MEGTQKQLDCAFQQAEIRSKVTKALGLLPSASGNQREGHKRGWIAPFSERKSKRRSQKQLDCSLQMASTSGKVTKTTELFPSPPAGRDQVPTAKKRYQRNKKHNSLHPL
ncbi:hypothetical protein GS18_0219325 [Metabacillus indicus]|uniref:Uncharacterized protein n=1 Tax=Metabacillus indicus TaxID=246786 RepID=A0A084GJN0_METID|nr:hypothetical protein GS18_0219325 [Metabacillus indicus]